MIRKATNKDIEKIAVIYERIIDADAQVGFVGWEKEVYPTKETAERGLMEGSLYVLTEDGEVEASAIINKTQPEEYRRITWEQDDAEPEKILVLHTLSVNPEKSGRGYGRNFVEFYENMALDIGCPYLRIDTNEKNKPARSMYEKLGYTERGIVETNFNGCSRCRLVLMEKYIGEK